jgi:hypothetical protein
LKKQAVARINLVGVSPLRAASVIQRAWLSNNNRVHISTFHLHLFLFRVNPFIKPSSKYLSAIGLNLVWLRWFAFCVWVRVEVVCGQCKCCKSVARMGVALVNGVDRHHVLCSGRLNLHENKTPIHCNHSHSRSRVRVRLTFCAGRKTHRNPSRPSAIQSDKGRMACDGA